MDYTRNTHLLTLYYDLKEAINKAAIQKPSTLKGAKFNPFIQETCAELIKAHGMANTYPSGHSVADPEEYAATLVKTIMDNVADFKAYYTSYIKTDDYKGNRECYKIGLALSKRNK